MAIIKNNQIIPDGYNILLDKWKSDNVFGLSKADKPNICIFNNSIEALKMINKHLRLNSVIAFHTDVDIDGIGTTYIIKKSLEYLKSNKHLVMINKDKVHGIQHKYVEFFEKSEVKPGLIIITDSSTNELELIKQFCCDVLVVDHHDVLHEDMIGTCNDGIHNYVIVNSTIGNKKPLEDKKWLEDKTGRTYDYIEDWQGTNDMSCGLVVYELMRLYCEAYDSSGLMENLRLYQWAGITLYTDAINTLNDRNQWYLDNTVFSREIEITLRRTLEKINKYKATIDKSYIQYKFAPLINKSIRASKGNEAVDIILRNPDMIMELNKYGKAQDEAIDSVMYANIKDETTGLTNKCERLFKGEYIDVCLDKYGIHQNYAGVIASKLSGLYNKNAVVYRNLGNNICKGSFRGRYNTVNYRKFFESYNESIYAQGHPPAFGFELKKSELDDIMNKIKEIEPKGEQRCFLSAGNMSEDERGIYHITDMEDFKRKGYLLMLAIGNSKVRSNDEIYIKVKSSDIKLNRIDGKLFYYDVLGLSCKAFSVLRGKYFNIYIEYTNEINLFIRQQERKD